MLTFNGKKYARNESELVDTLFKSGGTANGLYKTTKNKTLLYKPNGELFACISHNQKQGYFAVSASIQRDKPYFMYALCQPDEKYLGLDCIPYGQVAMLIRETFA